MWRAQAALQVPLRAWPARTTDHRRPQAWGGVQDCGELELCGLDPQHPAVCAVAGGWGDEVLEGLRIRRGEGNQEEIRGRGRIEALL